MNEEYRNDSQNEENEAFSENCYGKYTEGESSGDEKSYAYKTVLDGTPRSRGFSVASMVLGIVSICLSSGLYIGFILGGLAIVFSIVSRKILGYFDGMSIAGIILGIFGLVFSAFSIAVNLYLFTHPKLWRDGTSSSIFFTARPIYPI